MLSSKQVPRRTVPVIGDLVIAEIVPTTDKPDAVVTWKAEDVWSIARVGGAFTGVVA